MGYHRISIGFVAAALLALPFQELRADTTPKVIEEVDFAISCGPTSQKAFKHVAWTLHSFWYPEALEEFTAIAASEPACAMAYWGIAIPRSGSSAYRGDAGLLVDWWVQCDPSLRSRRFSRKKAKSLLTQDPPASAGDSRRDWAPRMLVSPLHIDHHARLQPSLPKVAWRHTRPRAPLSDALAFRLTEKLSWSVRSQPRGTLCRRQKARQGPRGSRRDPRPCVS
jgi:hypothetical protein